MKNIQEVLKEYSVELKSADGHVAIYTCKKVSQKDAPFPSYTTNERLQFATK